jgi:S1-C subfamily serine protease
MDKTVGAGAVGVGKRRHCESVQGTGVAIHNYHAAHSEKMEQHLRKHLQIESYPMLSPPRRRGSIRKKLIIKNYLSELIPAFARMTKNVAWLYSFILLAMAISPAHAQTQKIVHFSTGTGFVVHRDGYILTNAHVVQECNEVEVTGEHLQTTAEIIAKDSAHDIALLQTLDMPASAALFRSSNLPMNEGDAVLVVGHPLGAALTTRTAEFIADNGPLGEAKWLRFSNSVFQGNSGGPLLDGAGQVVGMIMAKATTYRFNEQSAQNEVVANADVAIQRYVLEGFLEEQGVRFGYGDNVAELLKDRVESIAQDFVVKIRCQID